MVKGAVKTLVEKNILRKDCFNEDKFDHTNWYTFTEYGESLVRKGRYVSWRFFAMKTAYTEINMRRSADSVYRK